MMNENGITMAAAKFVYKHLVELHKKGEDTSSISPTDIVNEYELWMVDEWSHLGYCIVTCLESSKLVETYLKGNKKVLDSLIGKTIKLANMTVDAEYIKELMPLVIEKYFQTSAP